MQIYCVHFIVIVVIVLPYHLNMYLYHLTLSRATEQYCAAGAVLKPLCLSKQLILCSPQHIDQLFLGHITSLLTYLDIECKNVLISLMLMYKSLCVCEHTCRLAHGMWYVEVKFVHSYTKQ